MSKQRISRAEKIMYVIWAAIAVFIFSQITLFPQTQIGTKQIRDKAITGAKLADGAVGETALKDDSVTESKLHPDVRAQLGGGEGATKFVDLTDVDTIVGQGGKYVKVKGTEDGLEYGTPAGDGTVGFTFVYDDTSVPDTGLVTSDIHIPFAATITEVTLFCDATGAETIGNITLDVQKTTYDTYPTDSTISDTGIQATFSGATYGKAQKTGASISEWISNTALTAGDILRVYITSISNVDRWRLIFKMTKQ